MRCGEFDNGDVFDWSPGDMVAWLVRDYDHHAGMHGLTITMRDTGIIVRVGAGSIRTQIMIMWNNATDAPGLGIPASYDVSHMHDHSIFRVSPCRDAKRRKGAR